MGKKSEILIELEENYASMQELVDQTKFSVGDAEKFLARYFNVVRKMEQLVESRDRWKAKYDELVKGGKKK